MLPLLADRERVAQMAERARGAGIADGVARLAALVDRALLRHGTSGSSQPGPAA